MEAPAHATAAPATSAVPWYRVLDRCRWTTLAAANLGWLFDAYEAYALVLTVAVALNQLVTPAQGKAIPFYAGLTKYTIVALLGAMTTTLGRWGISSWVTPYVGSLAAAQGLAAGQWASLAGMVYNTGAIAGYIACGFLADVWGRKRVTFAFIAFSLLLTTVLFLWKHDLRLVLLVCVVDGFFTLGQFTWMPIWLPKIGPNPRDCRRLRRVPWPARRQDTHHALRRLR
jgi:predicted MFS family arabinose efflux permease